MALCPHPATPSPSRPGVARRDQSPVGVGLGANGRRPAAQSTPRHSPTTSTLAAWPSPRRKASACKLIAQDVQALAGEDVTALDNDGPAAGRLAAVIEAEDGAGIDPVPAFRLVPAAAWGGGLAPSIALANIPSVQWNDHLVGFEDQFSLLFVRRGLLIQLGAEALGALARHLDWALERHEELEPL